MDFADPVGEIVEDDIEVNVIALGASGSGKSTFLQTLLNPKHEPVEFCPHAVTMDPSRLVSKRMKILGTAPASVRLTMFDTPGLLEVRSLQEGGSRDDAAIMKKVGEKLRLEMRNLSAFVICHNVDAKLDRKMVSAFVQFSEAIGSEHFDNTYLVLTHCDQFSREKCMQAFQRFRDFASTGISFFDRLFGPVDNPRVLFASAHNPILYQYLCDKGFAQARDALTQDVFEKREFNIRLLMGLHPVPVERTDFCKKLDKADFGAKFADELGKLSLWDRLKGGSSANDA
jgi:GTPase SAR1 family protein